jgi:anthranilate phosphoribosyltransferase
MGLPTSTWFATGLPFLLDRRDVPDELVRTALTDLTRGTFDDAEAAAFLIALRLKGESASEIAAAVSVLRTVMHPLDCRSRPVLDTCGTGGDGAGTFNISTATAFVVAAAGVPVVKHGNRSVSSRTGSADVLAALGVPIESGPPWSESTLDVVGIAFCFAPHFHPALAKVASLRRKLGVRTIFNLLGPLLNPASAEHQLLGVGSPELLDPMAGALARLGTHDSLLVCGRDGLDEVSLSAATQVRRIRDGRIESYEWLPTDFGLTPTSPNDLKVDRPDESADMIRQMLEGRDGAPRRVVLANAAAALLVTGRVSSLPDGVAVAARAIDSGAARRVLKMIAQPEA